MTHRLPGIAASTLFALFVTAPLAADDWKPVFSDNFERADVGKDWTALNSRPLKIVDGWLQISESDMDIAIIDKPFEGDLRIEFDAQATPGVPPCDISPMLYGNSFWGYGTGYHIAFGGASNTRAMIRCSGASADYEGPEAVIDPKKTYRIRAERDGAEVRLFIDGKLLLKAAVKEPVGGPGMDRIGVTAWTSCRIDNVTVSAKPPAMPVKTVLKLPPPAASPAAQAGLAAALALAGQVAHGEYMEMDREITDVAAAFADLAKKHSDDPVVQDYAWAAAQFGRVKHDNHPSVRLLHMGPENNPFYWKAMYYEAKRAYWEGKEGGSRRHFQYADGLFKQLREKFPKNDLVRQYLGERTEWGEEFKVHPEGTPPWAASLHEAYARQIHILEWWFKRRQAPDGQLGGGWGDDVELLRSWGPVAVVSTGAPAVMAGIEKMCDGIWNFCGKWGYEGGVGDVEHSAEPTADTHPPMLLLRHGDPKYYERNLRSAKTITEIYSAPDARGYPRFKSCFLGGDQWGTAPLESGDTPYHVRVAKALIWLAWAGNPEARDWTVRYADGWRDAIMREEAVSTPGVGPKPAGVPPAAIFFPSGGIEPPGGAPWWSPQAGCFGWPGFLRLTGDLQLCGYAFSGDRKFLEAFDTLMDFGESGPILRQEDHAKGSPGWLRASLQHFPDPLPLALRRWLTDERAYDGYLRKLGSPYMRYLATHDLAEYTKHLARVAESLRDNFPMRTSEVVYTDRAGMAAADDVLGAYCGAPRVWVDSGPPTVAVTWEAPDTNFAALVIDNSPTRLRVWVHNLRETPASYGLKLWSLVPGRYTVTQGEKAPGEREDFGQYRIANGTSSSHTHRHPGDVLRIEAPSRKTWVVDLRLVEPAKVPPAAPDFAIHARDLNLKDRSGKDSSRRVKVTVHNIGSAAGTCDVRMETRGGTPVPPGPSDGWIPAAPRPFVDLPAPKAFVPSTAEVLFDLPAGAVSWRVTLDPDGKVWELNELNNVAEGK